MTKKLLWDGGRRVVLPIVRAVVLGTLGFEMLRLSFSHFSGWPIGTLLGFIPLRNIDNFDAVLLVVTGIALFGFGLVAFYNEIFRGFLKSFSGDAEPGQGFLYLVYEDYRGLSKERAIDKADVKEFKLRPTRSAGPLVYLILKSFPLPIVVARPGSDRETAEVLDKLRPLFQNSGSGQNQTQIQAANQEKGGDK